MSRSLNSVIVRSGLVKLWKNSRVVKNYATYFTSYLVIYHTLQSILLNAFNYKIIDLKFYWINWLDKLIINIICFPYEDTSYASRVQTTRKDFLLKSFKRKLIQNESNFLEKGNKFFNIIKNSRTSSISRDAFLVQSRKDSNKFRLYKIQTLLLLRKLINLKNLLQNILLREKLMKHNSLQKFRVIHKLLINYNIISKKNYKKSATTLMLVYQGLKAYEIAKKKKYNAIFLKNLKPLKNIFLKNQLLSFEKLLLLKYLIKLLVKNKKSGKHTSKLIKLLIFSIKKGNLSKKNYAYLHKKINSALLILKNNKAINYKVRSHLLIYCEFLNKYVNIRLAKLKNKFWLLLNRKTLRRFYRLKMLSLYFWFLVLKYMRTQHTIQKTIQRRLKSSVIISNQVSNNLLIGKFVRLFELLIKNIRIKNTYIKYLNTKYSFSKKEFFMLSQLKLRNSSIFNKTNHAISRYYNKTYPVKITNDLLILHYLRLFNHKSTCNFKNKKRFHTLDKNSRYLLSLNKLNKLIQIKFNKFVKLNNKFKVSDNQKKTWTLLKKKKFVLKIKANFFIKTFQNNNNLLNLISSKYRMSNKFKKFLKLTNKKIKKFNILNRISANAKILLKLNNQIKQEAKKNVTQNFFSRLFKKLLLKYSQLFYKAYNTYLSSNIKSNQLITFTPIKNKSKNSFTEKNKLLAATYTYRDQFWMYRTMQNTNKLKTKKNQEGLWLNFKLTLGKCQSLYKNETKLLEYQTFMPLWYKVVQKVQRRKNIFLNIFLSEILGKNIHCLVLNPIMHFLIPRVHQRLTVNHYKTLALPRIKPHKSQKYYLNTFNLIWQMLTFKTEGIARLFADHIARELKRDRRHYPVLQCINDIFEKAFQISKKNIPEELSHLKTIKIEINGKIKGSSRTRKYEKTFISNNLPLLKHTSPIDMAMSSTDTVYGTLGIKIWIMYN